jgi:hypothetical protein
MKSRQVIAYLSYALFCILLSAYSLSEYSGLLLIYLRNEYSFGFEVCAVTLQVPFQWLFLFKTNWSQRFLYALIALGVSALGALMLLPCVIFVELIASAEAHYALLYFLCVVGVLFSLHCFLLKRFNFTLWLAFGWLAYRFLLLAAITTENWL